MRKSILMYSAFATALLLGSCSSNEPVNTGENNEVMGQAKYMAITINTGSELPMITRAEGDEETPSTPTLEGSYEEGSENENAVKSLDFYFFYNDGTAAAVKNGGLNHIPFTKEDLDLDGADMPNISQSIKAVVVISTQDGDAIPDQIVAVINRDDSYAGLSLAQLQEKLTEGGDNENGFVMSNSVYVSGGVAQCGVPIAGHLCSKEDEALANPVTIYVERTLAKASLINDMEGGVTLSDGTKIYNPNKPADDKTEEYDGKQIYVQLLGWNTTAVSEKNRLLKSINSSWSNSWTWNTADFHRSFWAINAPGNTYKYFAFEPNPGEEGETAETANTANRYTDFTGAAASYLKENAGINNRGANPTTPSKVIIAAKLVDENGNDVEMAEWAFQRMTVEKLKDALANAATLYKKVVITNEDESTTTKMVQITPAEIELKTATAAGFTGQDDRRYLVYAALTEEAAAESWYVEPRLEGLTPLTEAQIKEVFFGLGGAKVWTGGRTYYYFDIRHLAYGNSSADFGQIGVVRNHVYKATVTSLFGLGTPVYDPYEVIIPEKPNDDDTFIAAEVKVLSWRLVDFDVELDWY